MKKDFLISSDEEIKKGLVTDAYFERTEEVLKKSEENPYVVMELFLRFFPNPDYTFGLFLGSSEVAKLLEGIPVEVDAMEEGEIFFPLEPVLTVRGNYVDFARYETAIIGFVSFFSGVGTKASRIKLASDGKEVYSFGTRRQHPVLAPAIEYASYIAGLDGVSNVLGAQHLGIKASGTMPHALILTMGSDRRAFEYFDRYIDESVPRIALVDTFGSPVKESLEALDVLGDRLYGIRIDSKDYVDCIPEIRWLFKQKGVENLKIYLSGGLDEYEVERLRSYVDGFGVGTRLANAPVLDFALKIVEVNRIPLAKVGNLSGEKQVYRAEGYNDILTLKTKPSPERYKSLLKPLIRDGKIVREKEEIATIRDRVVGNLNHLPTELKKIKGGILPQVKLL